VGLLWRGIVVFVLTAKVHTSYSKIFSTLLEKIFNLPEKFIGEE
jgi:hypothetical protein